MNALQTRSMTCWPPVVTSTSCGSTCVPSSAMTSTIASRAARLPSVGPYCSARAEDSAATPLISLASSSAGNVLVSGRPPASEITSGRSVIAIRSRMAELVMTRVREAKSPAYRSSSRAVPVGGREVMGDRPASTRPRERSSRQGIDAVDPRYRSAAVRLVLDILQGAGIAGAAGLRPFLPTLVSGGLAMADAGVNYDGTDFAFLES